jgi:hypothetical protein
MFFLSFFGWLANTFWVLMVFGSVDAPQKTWLDKPTRSINYTS